MHWINCIYRSSCFDFSFSLAKGFDFPPRCTIATRFLSILMRVGWIVRTYQPSRAMTNRIVRWIQELSSTQQVMIFISVDTTCGLFKEQRNELIREVENLNFANVFVHEYCEKDMELEFPGLGEIQVLSAQRESWKRYRAHASLAWGFHWETLVLLAEKAESYFRSLEYIWVVEDDVGFTGNISDLVFGKYGNSEADVLTKSLEVVFPMCDLHDEKSGWVWFNTCSEKYDQFVGVMDGGFRYFSSEHCQRFSKRYFDWWIEKTKEGIHAWSEQGTPMVALKLGFMLEAFDSNDLGTPFSFDGELNEQEWMDLENNPNERGKLFHALKF
jgi:hypothetical protein